MDNKIRYIALLRGINVGGHRPLKMKHLRNMFRQMGYESISTFIQSGNVIFDAPEQNEKELASGIQKRISDTFEYDVPVFIRTYPRLQKIFEQFPFSARKGWKGYITFLSGPTDKSQREELESKSGPITSFNVQEREVYSFVNKQATEKPQFSNSFIEKKLGMSVTTRNMRTTEKILELASPSY